ncbi:MAG: phosphatase PAP2 family protein [Kofleriaceae bacterium]
MPAPDAAAAGSGSGIAPPAPDAPPEKVEKAKDVANQAKLTPIIPSPNNPTQPAFQLYAEIDVPILATGLVFALARLTQTRPAYCAPLCSAEDKANLNPIDRWVAGRYSAAWSTASDFELYGLGAATIALLIPDEGFLNMLNDGVVIGEATLSATATASVLTIAAGRPRPFLYSETAPLSVRNSADAGLSFLSSHTSEAFAIVTSLYITEKRLHPNARYPKVVLAGGLVLASMIGVSRVAAGYHFVTDVVGGAVVGSSLGILIGSLHGSPVQVVPVVNHDDQTRSTSAGMSFSGTF